MKNRAILYNWARCTTEGRIQQNHICQSKYRKKMLKIMATIYKRDICKIEEQILKKPLICPSKY